MDIQIRTSELTEEQRNLESSVFVACEILKTHGLKCEVVKTVVSSPNDSPAYIYFPLP